MSAREEVRAAAEEVAEIRAQLTAAEQRRDAAVRRAREERVPYAELEEVTGLSRQRIDQIRRGTR